MIKQVTPIYPKEAKDNKLPAVTVDLFVRVGKTGFPTKVTVVRGKLPFTQAALDAVKQWQWTPYKLNGEPVEVETTVSVNFLPKKK